MKSSESGSPAIRKSLGVSACTAIVIGNMVGSGFYLSPAAMAPYGNLAILAWTVMELVSDQPGVVREAIGGFTIVGGLAVATEGFRLRSRALTHKSARGLLPLWALFLPHLGYSAQH